MSINRIDFPNAAPIAIADWEAIIDVAEFNTLGVGNPVDYDFSGNTIKQGVQIMIGGSIYQSVTATAITGTPSDYVRITPAGAVASALYVSSLVGVTWNSVYNHYQDGSGNAYLFNEAKAELADPKTVVGKFAQDAYVGTLITRGQTILARDGGNVLIKTLSDTGEGLHIGSGGMRITGTAGNIILASSGNRIDLTRASISYIRASEPSGYIGILTNGRSTVSAETNVIFNADKTTTFNGELSVTSGGMRVTGTTGNVIIDSTGTMQWKRYYKNLSSPTSGDVYNALSTWIPNVGDFITVHGQAINGIFSSDGVSINSIDRSSASVITVYYGSGNIVSSFNISSGSSVIFATGTIIMSNFDAIT